MKDWIEDIKDAERRFFTGKIEVRAEGEGAGVVEGEAAVVNQWTDMGWYEESIAPGAFEGRLNDDIVALKNHNINYVLARTSSQTLEVFVNGAGNLGYRYTTPTGRQHAVDLLDEIRTGDISQSSFAFVVSEAKWEFATKENGLEMDRRTITKFERLIDVSPVTFAAYPSTSVAARSLEGVKKELRDTTLIMKKRQRQFEFYKNEKR